MGKKRKKVKVHITGILLDPPTQTRAVSFYWLNDNGEQYKATIPVKTTDDVWEAISQHIHSEPFAVVGQEREV